MSVPRAAYRLQLHADFPFDAAAELADYLRELGISHLYCSPVLQAAPGSAHGYDCVDPTRASAELGGEAGFARLARALAGAGLELLLDIVPSHLAIGPENPWWWDVLENGPASRYAPFFAVDWELLAANGSPRILLPVLDDHCGRLLERGGILVERRGGDFGVRSGEQRFPLSPRALDGLLGAAAARAGSLPLRGLADGFAALPSPRGDARLLALRHHDKEDLRARLAELLSRDPAAAAAVDGAVAELNADPDALDALLSRQDYRLAHWRMSEAELPYRRFFNISSLVRVRQEDPDAFAHTHRRVLDWARDGKVSGLRIDHVDGLCDPEGYLRRLREAVPGAWILVEKILAPGENLPESWPVAGTTGYEFLNLASGLFIDPAGERGLSELYAEFTGEPLDYAALVREKKLLVLREELGSELARLAHLLREICLRHRRQRDHTRARLEAALSALIACLPVYRAYARAQPPFVSPEDALRIERAAEAAKRSAPELDGELFDFLRELLLLRVPGAEEAEFALQFQQASGSAAAKGVEDTAFYCFNRLLALNEVGGDPARFGRDPAEFHADCEQAGRRWPLRLLAGSTHDTKRSEDCRARLAALSELPERWAAAVRRWSALNEKRRRGPVPDRNAEYALYQTLVGAWPIDAGRLTAYLRKAAREAKARTTWTRPDPAYEEALESFALGALSDEAFTGDLNAFAAELAAAGRINSLALSLLRLTAPGVPDLYQGDELWNLNLVDPDNRRPVDFALRRRLLAQAREAGASAALAGMESGLPKLWLILRALALRRRLPDAFGPGSSYRALASRGRRAQHALGFVRGERVAALVPRLVLGLAGDWSGTKIELPAGRWRCALTGEPQEGGLRPVEELLARFPVALLEREG